MCVIITVIIKKWKLLPTQLTFHTASPATASPTTASPTTASPTTTSPTPQAPTTTSPTTVIYQPNDESRPTLDQIRWEGVSGEHHIDPNFYNNAQIIVAPSICFDRDQDCLRQIAEGIKKGHHKKGFNRGYKWYKSNYTSKFLLDRGFMKVSTNTIFVVQDGEGKYVVKFVYSPISKNTTDDPLLALSQHIFPLDENVRTLAGQSIVTGDIGAMVS